ncbi:MAG TPA: winged helix-turn-helix domain-containing protein, partial [Candidatus Cloacimonadota bacterium]|nr:winged helix-turn-helix domain-containing protein [Candidatus Cloacimonadota bacterium]
TTLLNSRHYQILTILENNNKISTRQIAEIVGINHSAVIKHLNIMKKEGLIIRVGGTHGYWEIQGSTIIKK